MDIDTHNDFFLGVSGYPEQTFSFMFPPGPMDKAAALRTAAWLVALADPMNEEFPAVFKAICNT
jgi:hypothetical protein